MYGSLFLIVLFVILYVWLNQGCSEDFKVLGSLAPQKAMYYKCLSDCEKGDPAFNLTHTKGSMSCQAYCDSTITDIVRRGGPSYPLDLPVAPVAIKTRIDKAYDVCGDGTKGNQCRKNFATDGEIDEKCRQNCAYSSLPVKECMKQCHNILKVNKTTGWSWK